MMLQYLSSNYFIKIINCHSVILHFIVDRGIIERIIEVSFMKFILNNKIIEFSILL